MVTNAASFVMAVLLGAWTGAALAGWRAQLGARLSDAPDAVLGYGVLAGAFLVLGVRLDSLRGPVNAVGSALSGRLVALGGLTVALGTTTINLSTLVPLLGGDLGAAPWWLHITRALAALLFVGPAALLLGSILRLGARTLPDGVNGGRSLALAVVGAGLGWTLAHAGSLSSLDAPIAPLVKRGEFAVGLGLALLVAGAAGLLLTRKRGRTAAAPAASEERLAPRELGLSPSWSGAGIGVGLAAFSFLGLRIFAAVFGETLGAHSPVLLAWGASLTVGGLAGAVFFSRLPGASLPGWGAALLSVGAATSVFSLANYDALPAQFYARWGEATSLRELFGDGFRLALPRVAMIGLTLGAAAALVASRLPQSRAARAPWIAGLVTGAALGGIVGRAVALVALPAQGLTLTLVFVALLVITPPTVAAVRGGLPGVARVLLALVAPGLVAGAAVRVEPADRDALIVESGLRSDTSVIDGVQKHWRVFDEDDLTGTWSILQRGQLRRLFLNGRFEFATEASLLNGGLLAHLPLSVHTAPKRVAVLGTGAGSSLQAALAHPIDTLHTFESGPTAFRALAKMRLGARDAVLDSRTALFAGDYRELLRRASEPYDVVLNQAAGQWGVRSAETSTIEFLTEVHAHLGDDGIYAQRVPGSSLTREGFLHLLSTIASVFPQVECWGGEGGSVVVLAKKQVAPHDFSRVVSAYRAERVAADAEERRIGTPDTLFSRFLVGDATVRRICAAYPPHSGSEPYLGPYEGNRAFRSQRVNPVPGLAELGDDPVEAVVGLPSGADTAIYRAYAATQLVAEGLELEYEDEDLAAAEKYREAVDLNPRDGSARRALATLRSRLGIIYHERKSLSAAHANMREAVEVDTTYAQGFANLGWMLLQVESYDYAISCTRQAIALAPDDDLFPLQLGRIWKNRGYFDEALPWYERAAELNPRNIDAGIGLVDTKLAMQGNDPDLEWGREYLEKYLEWEPEHEELRLRIEKLDAVLARGGALPEQLQPFADRAAKDAAAEAEAGPVEAPSGSADADGGESAAGGRNAAPGEGGPGEGGPASEDAATARNDSTE